MEAEVNKFTKRSKRYKTKYFDQLKTLWNDSKTQSNSENLTVLKRSENSSTYVADKNSV